MPDRMPHLATRVRPPTPTHAPPRYVVGAQFLMAVFNKPAKISKRKTILNFLGLRRDDSLSSSLSYAQESM